VNKELEIRLNTIHVGSARRVVTLGLDGKDHALEFLDSLAKSNRSGFEAIRARVRAVAERNRFENDRTFNNLGDGLYEFKGPGLRLYAFYDELPGLQPQLVIATNGGSKNTRKEQQIDFARARLLRHRYLESKPRAKIRLIILPHEN
jgi:hypothetical protein